MGWCVSNWCRKSTGEKMKRENLWHCVRGFSQKTLTASLHWCLLAARGVANHYSTMNTNTVVYKIYSVFELKIKLKINWCILLHGQDINCVFPSSVLEFASLWRAFECSYFRPRTDLCRRCCCYEAVFHPLRRSALFLLNETTVVRLSDGISSFSPSLLQLVSIHESVNAAPCSLSLERDYY